MLARACRSVVTVLCVVMRWGWRSQCCAPAVSQQVFGFVCVWHCLSRQMVVPLFWSLVCMKLLHYCAVAARLAAESVPASAARRGALCGDPAARTTRKDGGLSTLALWQRGTFLRHLCPGAHFEHVQLTGRWHVFLFCFTRMCSFCSEFVVFDENIIFCVEQHVFVMFFVKNVQFVLLLIF